MKKLLLTIAYPFWFFLSKTMLGICALLIAVVYPPAGIFDLLTNGLLTKSTGTDASYIGIGVILISIPFYLIEIYCLAVFGDYLKENYKKLGYKTEL